MVVFYTNGADTYSLVTKETDLSAKTISRALDLAQERYLTDSILKTVLLLIGIYAVSMFLFYLLSRYMSGLAAAPMEKAIAREKQFITDISHDLKTPLTLSEVNLSQITQKALLQLDSLAFESGISIEEHIEDDLFVRGNLDYCSRIVSCLLENAIKHEEAGGQVTGHCHTSRL